MEKQLDLAPYVLTLLWEDEEAPILYTVSEAQEARSLWAALPSPRPSLVCVDKVDWERDLSPWPARRAFRGGDDFSGGAEAFLMHLLEEILPRAEAGLSPAWRGIFGYSLAGLFSLWSMTKTNAFARVASVSGSLWFDGFTEHLAAATLSGKPERIYLSLGDREAKAKDPRMKTVHTATEAARAILEEKGIPCQLVMNPGGHFQDPLQRQQEAVLFLLR